MFRSDPGTPTNIFVQTAFITFAFCPHSVRPPGCEADAALPAAATAAQGARRRIHAQHPVQRGRRNGVLVSALLQAAGPRLLPAYARVRHGAGVPVSVLPAPHQTQRQPAHPHATRAQVGIVTDPQ